MSPQKKAWKTRKAEKGRCVVCHSLIIERSDNGKAKTCNQSCAGKLAWETRLSK